nr:M23 family metallopeptidase [uncultured Bacillus sp.]
MHARRDDIRKRIEKRKKDRERMTKQMETRLPWTEDEERYGFQNHESFESGPIEEESHPLFRKEVWIFKLLASACLVLIIAIIYRNQSPVLDGAREFVAKSMEEDFQFAAVSEWYESTFGEQLALLPSTNSNKQKEIMNDIQYALPASGKILEEFGENGQRITIEIAKDAPVEAMNGGFVSFVGEKEGFGNAVVIQHADKSESWYGNLSSIDVSLYEYVEKGAHVGKATTPENSTHGSFYFAIKEGEKFVDPGQVIQPSPGDSN